MADAPVTITMRPAKSGIWSTENLDFGGIDWPIIHPTYFNEDRDPPMVIQRSRRECEIECVQYAWTDTHGYALI